MVATLPTTSAMVAALVLTMVLVNLAVDMPWVVATTTTLNNGNPAGNFGRDGGFGANHSGFSGECALGGSNNRNSASNFGYGGGFGANSGGLSGGHASGGNNNRNSASNFGHGGDTGANSGGFGSGQFGATCGRYNGNPSSNFVNKTASVGSGGSGSKAMGYGAIQVQYHGQDDLLGDDFFNEERYRSNRA
ncbi:circumsporozoite protein-like [Oryza brachyantha]|uniref:circumsporozoite protein-like n=1 Tax=Oryza brachyantha TaxID=4533 RepID=UPI00077652A4|nr:circumsporozoite protein-like [Oryza brachyantha]